MAGWEREDTASRHYHGPFAVLTDSSVSYVLIQVVPQVTQLVAGFLWRRSGFAPKSVHAVLVTQCGIELPLSASLHRSSIFTPVSSAGCTMGPFAAQFDRNSFAAL